MSQIRENPGKPGDSRCRRYEQKAQAWMQIYVVDGMHRFREMNPLPCAVIDPVHT
jgi:hypothetical protein